MLGALDRQRRARRGRDRFNIDRCTSISANPEYRRERTIGRSVFVQMPLPDNDADDRARREDGAILTGWLARALVSAT